MILCMLIAARLTARASSQANDPDLRQGGADEKIDALRGLANPEVDRRPVAIDT